MWAGVDGVAARKGTKVVVVVFLRNHIFRNLKMLLTTP